MSIQIITKKLSKLLNTRPNALTIGDVRKQMSIDLLKNLTSIIERKANYKKPYWILIHAKLDPSYPSQTVIKEKLLILPKKPPIKYIGSILVKIDNQHADATIEWNLPLDIPAHSLIKTVPGRRGTLKDGEAGIMDSARGLPIFHGGMN